MNHSDEEPTSARIGENSSLNVEGKDDVEIVLSNICKSKLAKIKNVIYTSSPADSLVSVSSLVCNGFRTAFALSQA